MKKALLGLLILICNFQSYTTSAQVPESINYQAVARDTAGNPLSNTSMLVKLSLIAGSATGAVIWQETHSVTTNTLGLFSVKLGEGTSTGVGTISPFSTINWGSFTCFLKTEIKLSAGFVDMGTEPLSSVPFSLHSKTTAALPNGTNIGDVLTWNGNAWVTTSVCAILPVYYQDADMDGVGDTNVQARSCTPIAGYTTVGHDCNDFNPLVSPLNNDLCDGYDNNCDGIIDNLPPAISNTDPLNCGGCGNICPPAKPNAYACYNGVCGFHCKEDFFDCNNDPNDGCEVSSSMVNCGGCGIVCPPHPNMIGSCNNGACEYQCFPGFGDCDNKLSTGCETLLAPGYIFCASCSTSCAPKPNATASCFEGVCYYSCLPGFGNCNNDMVDGCETSLTSISNCMACGLICALPNANSTSCATGTCSIVTCYPGYADCNLFALDGCETEINYDFNNCGGCGFVCAAPNANMSCTNGICTLSSCVTNYADCNNDMSDGCETYLLSDPNNCSACGVACPAAPNSSSACINGTCQTICLPGYGDCDNDPFNGCEINLSADINNCNGCGYACPSPPNAVASCVLGNCQFSCLPGFGDCDNQPFNGCETNLNSDVVNCNGCGNFCPSPPNAVSTCVFGNCQFTCNPGFYDCNSAPFDGCESTSVCP